VIALALLHPRQAEPVHRWTFDQISLIRVGRSNNNDVVLYSAVISRHHLELHYQAGVWWAVNRGKNGTYLNNVAIKQSRLVDNMTLCLAKSGPRLQISIADRVISAPNSRLSTHVGHTMPELSEDDDDDEMTIVDMRTEMLG
jgi:pSer/pThr/pTyr-binding forkhead associated (FHA) protein